MTPGLTWVQSILLLAPGDLSDAQEAGEVIFSRLDRWPSRALGGAGMAAEVGWKNSAGSWKGPGEEPPHPAPLLSQPCPPVRMLLLLLSAPPTSTEEEDKSVSWRI